MCKTNVEKNLKNLKAITTVCVKIIAPEIFVFKRIPKNLTGFCQQILKKICFRR